MSDSEFLLSSLGLLFVVCGIIVWFYVRRVRQAHRYIKQKMSGILNAGGDDNVLASSQRAMPSFKFPTHLKIIVLVLLLASGVFLALAIIGLVITLGKVTLVILAIVMWAYLVAFIWRRIGAKFNRRRGKVWYEED